MKIVFFRHSLLNRGGDKMVVAHAAQLAECSHTVIIQTTVLDTLFEIHPDVTIKKNNVSSKVGTIWEALKKNIVADIIVGDIITMCTVLGFRNRNRVVYFAQDYDETYYPYKLQQLFIRIIYFIGLNFLKIPTIAVSDKLATILKKRYGVDVDVVQNGVDLIDFYYEPSIELISKKNNNISILLFSRRDYRKGFDVGIKTIKDFQKKNDISFEVWTVGDEPGDVFPDISHRHFGYVNVNSLRRIISSADVLLYPSRHEGFGLMVLEALACRCPVVTTWAVPFAIHGETTLNSETEDYYGLSENLYQIISDKDFKGKLVNNGIHFARKNSLKNSTKKFEKILTQKFLKVFTG